MDPRLLAQIQAQLQQMAQSSAAAANAAVSLSQALQGAGTAASGSLGKLDSSAARTAQSFSDLTASMPQWRLSMFQLVKAVGQAVLGHVQFAGSMMRLNRTIYETESVFQNMSSQLEAGQNAISGVIGTVGTALQAIPVFGTAFAKGLDAAGQAALSIANEQFQLLISASSRVSEGLKRTSSQFGLLTTNLDDFSHRAGQAGLTSEQFARILSSNSNSLNQAFGSVEKGANFMSAAFNTFFTQVNGKALLRQFRGLGFEIDDVAEAIADYAALQTMTGRQQAESADQQIRDTLNYVKNLKVLQAITGEDIKVQKQRQRELLQQAAFRAKYDRMMAEGNQEQAEKMMFAAQMAGQFGPAAQKAFTEMITSGQILTSESAVFAQQFPQLASMLQEMSKRAQQSGEGLEDFRQSTGKLLETSQARIKSDQKVLDQSGLLVAGLASNSPYLQSLSQGFVAIEDVAGKFSNVSKTIDEVQANLNKAANIGKVGEFEFENFFLQQQQRMKVEGRLFEQNSKMLETTQEFLTSMNKAQNEVNNLYSSYAAKVATLVAGLGDAVADLRGNETAALRRLITGLNTVFESPPQTESNLNRQLEELKTKEIDLRKKANEGLSGAAEELKVIQQNLKEVGRGLSRKNIEAEIYNDATQRNRLFSDGGIAAGPRSGYQAILHGIEAVVPLPDGKTIPVTLDTSQLETAMNDLVNKISVTKDPGSFMPDLVRYLEANNSVNREILRELKKGTDISNKILRTNS